VAILRAAGTLLLALINPISKINISIIIANITERDFYVHLDPIYFSVSNSKSGAEHPVYILIKVYFAVFVLNIWAIPNRTPNRHFLNFNMLP